MADSTKYRDPRTLRYHPYNIVIGLTLASITALFLAFSVAYIYSRVQNGLPAIQLPYLFYVNTGILMASGFTLYLAKKAYLNDDTTGYQNALLYTIILTFLFLIAQMFAWAELFRNIPIDYSNTASYLYVVSGMHFMHVIAGLPFLIFFWIAAKKRMKEPVSVMVYFSDPEKRMKLRLLTVYWHFLDLLWIYLVFFFGINCFF